MAFTTWADLHRQMLDDLASGAWRRFSGYSLAGRSYTYRSLDEFRKLLDWVKEQADLETGAPRFRRRTRARQGGRG